MKKSIKLFESKKVRTYWDEVEKKWYFSITDIIAILTDSIDPLAYWRKLKERLKKEGNESVTICHGFIAFLFQPLYQFTPIGKRVNAFSQYGNYIHNTKIPLLLFFIPNGTDAFFFKKFDV